MAEFKVFATTRDDLRDTNLRMACASNAGKPWICRTTSRIFCADIRTFFVIAWTSMLLGLRLGGVRAVFLECAGQRKLAQLVADHVFSHEHRLKNFPVMHVECMADK